MVGLLYGRSTDLTPAADHIRSDRTGWSCSDWSNAMKVSPPLHLGIARCCLQLLLLIRGGNPSALVCRHPKHEVSTWDGRSVRVCDPTVCDHTEGETFISPTGQPRFTQDEEKRFLAAKAAGKVDGWMQMSHVSRAIHTGTGMPHAPYTHVPVLYAMQDAPVGHLDLLKAPMRTDLPVK